MAKHRALQGQSRCRGMSGVVSERRTARAETVKCLDLDVLAAPSGPSRPARAIRYGIFTSSERLPSTKHRGDKMSPTEVERG